MEIIASVGGAIRGLTNNGERRLNLQNVLHWWCVSSAKQGGELSQQWWNTPLAVSPTVPAEINIFLPPEQAHNISRANTLRCWLRSLTIVHILHNYLLSLSLLPTPTTAFTIGQRRAKNNLFIPACTRLSHFQPGPVCYSSLIKF